MFTVKQIHGKPNQQFGKMKGVTSRACSKCGGDLGDRYGKTRYCKTCHAAYMRMNRTKYSELDDGQKKRNRCRAFANVYLKRGAIKKQACKKCGSDKSQMHHKDYDKPLEVIWFCRPCHLIHHKQQQNGKQQTPP